MRYLFFFALISGITLWYGCKTDPACAAPSPKPLNPNGDSELAILMRSIFDDGMKMKAQIEQGAKPTIGVDFEKIHSAIPTEPQKVASDAFQGYAQSYVHSMKALQEATPENAKAIYLDVVNTCMNCHKEVCPGPTMRIKKMYF